jgi:hypothetical protein
MLEADSMKADIAVDADISYSHNNHTLNGLAGSGAAPQ